MEGMILRRLDAIVLKIRLLASMKIFLEHLTVNQVLQ